MKKISRSLLFGALALLLLTAACAEATPTTIATSGPIGRLASATAATPTGSPQVTVDTTVTPVGITDTSGVPVTGPELTLLQCQYCIEGMAHALLILPDTVTFATVADAASLSTPGPDTGCTTVDRFNGRQVVICRGQENSSMSLNICTDSNNCTQLLVELQSCPATNQPGATNTPEAGAPTNTAVVGVTETPAAVASPTATP
jgi:hypothetical protein